MANTGAVMQGPCPGCGRAIVGMMPQRCFFCGHDFTEEIKAQNASFVPDPNYKSLAADATPTEDEVYQELKNRERYGPDPFAAAAEALGVEMDGQKTAGEALQKSLQESMERFVPNLDSGVDPLIQFKEHIAKEFPSAEIDDMEAWRDPVTGSLDWNIKAKLTFPQEKIIVEATKVGGVPFRHNS